MNNYLDKLVSENHISKDVASRADLFLRYLSDVEVPTIAPGPSNMVGCTWNIDGYHINVEFFSDKTEVFVEKPGPSFQEKEFAVPYTGKELSNYVRGFLTKVEVIPFGVFYNEIQTELYRFYNWFFEANGNWESSYPKNMTRGEWQRLQEVWKEQSGALPLKGWKPKPNTW